MAVVALGLAYFVVAAGGIGLYRLSGGAAGLWVANAVAVAVMLRRPETRPWQALLAVAIASGAAQLAWGAMPLQTALFTAANTAEIWLSLALLDRIRSAKKTEIGSVGGYLATLGIAGALAPATVSALYAVLCGLLFDVPPLQVFAGRWSSNAIGYALFFPAFMLATRTAVAETLEKEGPIRLAGIALACVVFAVLAALWTNHPFILTIVPLFAAATRLPPFYVSILSALVGAAMVTLGAAGVVIEADAQPGLTAGGYRLSVAVATVLPFLASLLLDQIARDHKRIEEAEGRWNFALESAGQGVWDVDVRAGKTYYSPMWKRILGYRVEELEESMDMWLEVVHPDDRDRLAVLDKVVMTGALPVFGAEFRMRHKDGRWLWVRDRGRVVERDADGKPLRLIGAFTDISEEKIAEERLAEEKERLRITLHSIADAVICTDAANRITFMNPAAEQLTGFDVIEAYGKRLDEVFTAVDEETGEPIEIGPKRDNEGANCDADPVSQSVLVRRDGTRRNLRQAISRILTAKQELAGLAIIFQDVTEFRARQRDLAFAASHDPLTGLANRASFVRTLRDLLDDARVNAAAHALLFVDLDRFKPVNDTAGHLAGDALLKRVAGAIRSQVRQNDVVFRFGGDEFAVLLRGCTTDDAVQVGNAIVARVGDLGFTWEGRRLSVGASVGVTAIDTRSGEMDEVVAQADEACYAAKAAGRGCVVVYGTDEIGKAPPRLSVVGG